MYLGIDVAKHTLRVLLLRPTGKRKQRSFANTPAGHQELLEWLAEHAEGPAHACLEATGTYAEAVATTLHAHGHRVSLINPCASANHARKQLRRTKTDPVDAAVLADYCQKEQPTLWSPPPPAVRELQALVRRLESLREMRQMEANRLEALTALPRKRPRRWRRCAARWKPTSRIWRTRSPPPCRRSKIIWTRIPI